MKTTGILITIAMSVLLILDIIFAIKCDYEFENEIGSYWSLADKASTISKKSEYIDMFVDRLEKSGLNGKYNAVMYTTPDNFFDNNLGALKTLQQRLYEIEKMDITSFEYQTAIQQITAQEQGEAQSMLAVFGGIWTKDNYFLLWNWVGGVQVGITIILLIVGIIIWINESDCF